MENNFCLKDSRKDRATIMDDNFDPEDRCEGLRKGPTFTGGHGYQTEYFCRYCHKSLFVLDYR